MSITVFNDVILPEIVLGTGVRGKQMRKNERTQAGDGSMRVNIDWDTTLREFEVGYKAMGLEAWSAIEALFEITEGGAYGFLMLDPKDSVVSAAEGRLGSFNNGFPLGAVGSGYGEPVLYLYKRTTSVGSTRTKDRLIGRPLSPAIFRNGSPVTVGGGAGNIAIDLDAGKVTFVADFSRSITSVTTGTTTVLQFASATGLIAALAVGQRVFITGTTGTASALLNGLSHAITAKDEALFTLTISTNTNGLAINAASGTAFKYPQAADALTWSGQFYVPVHFMNDELDWEMLKTGPRDGRIVAGPSVTLVQVLEMPE